MVLLAFDSEDEGAFGDKEVFILIPMPVIARHQRVLWGDRSAIPFGSERWMLWTLRLLSGVFQWIVRRSLQMVRWAWSAEADRLTQKVVLLG